MVFSQLIDTVLFSFLALYNVVDSVFSIIIVSYAIKLISIIFSGSFCKLFKGYVKV